MENTVNVLARQKIILEILYHRFNRGSLVLDLEPSIHVKKVLSHDTVPSADLESRSFRFRNTYFSSVSDLYLFDTDKNPDPDTVF
jgi:hypothetical protein